jgi:quercetin dioxygenase-like cupin family protein
MKKTTNAMSRFPVAQSIRLVDLANYQTGAIVSREILRKKTGTVTLFAFDAGQGLSEHTAPFDALVQVLDGEARITIAGKRHRVRTGESILMPAKVPHALKADSRFMMMLTLLRA